MILKSMMMLAAVAAGAAAAALPQQPDRAATVGVVGVVGQWTEEVEAGTAAVRVDGVPGRAPSAAEIEKTAIALFGRLDPAFAANASAPGAFSLAVVRDVPRFAEGTFRARFKLVSGATDQTAGLVFNLQPTGDYLYARYNTKDGNLALWRYTKGAREVIAHGEQHVQLPLGVWHELAVTITATRLVAAANDGMLRFEHGLPGPIDGRVGFWTKRDSITMFKDVRVSPRTK